MRIVVSGADGFLGSHVLERLRDGGRHEVVGVTLVPEALAGRFVGWDGLSVVRADLGEMAAAPELEGADAFLACAFPRAAGPEGMGEGLDFVYGSLGLMLDRGCRAVVNVSSQSVYDPHRAAPAKEGDPVLLTSEYAVAKYCVELSVARMCRDAGVPFANVRMASLIGPGFDQRFVNKMVKAALETGAVTVTDDGSRFGFLDVLDAAEGLRALLECDPSAWPPVCNMGPEGACTASEVAAAVAEAVPGATVANAPAAVPGGGRSALDTSVDGSLLHGLCGWRPRVGLRESVLRIASRALGGVSAREGRGDGGLGMAGGDVR